MSPNYGHRRNTSSARSRKKNLKERLWRAYEWFLELPVPVVFLLIVAIAVVVTTVLQYDAVPMTYDHADFAGPYDHQFYLSMATGDTFGQEIAPFNRRILTPLIAKTLPWGVQENFRAVTFFGVCGSGVGMYYLNRAFGADRALSVAGMLMFFSLIFATYFAFYDFWLVDPLNFLITVLCILSLAAKRDFLFALLLALGALNKESALILLSLCYTLRARSFIDLEAAQRTLVLSLPACLVWATLYWAIPQGNDYSYLLTFMGAATNLYSTLSPELIKQCTVWTFGAILCFLPIFALGTRENATLLLKFLPFLGLIYLQLFFVSGSPERLLVLGFPVIIVLSVLGMREIAQRLGARSWWFVALPLSSITLNIYFVSFPSFVVPVAPQALVFTAYLAAVFVLSGQSSKNVGPWTHKS